MKTIVLIILAAAVSAFAKGEPNPHDLIPIDVADIIIEQCDYDPHGINVHFNSSYDGPHVVAVYPWAYIYSGSRLHPLCSVVTESDSARIDGDFCTYATCFVQVFVPSITNAFDRTYRDKVIGSITTNNLFVSIKNLTGDWGVRTQKHAPEPLYVKHVHCVTNWVDGFRTYHYEYKPGPHTIAERQMHIASLEWFYRNDIDKLYGQHSIDEGMHEAFYWGRSNAWPINRLTSETLFSASGQSIGVTQSGKIILTDQDSTTNQTGENK